MPTNRKECWSRETPRRSEDPSGLSRGPRLNLLGSGAPVGVRARHAHRSRGDTARVAVSTPSCHAGHHRGPPIALLVWLHRRGHRLRQEARPGRQALPSLALRRGDSRHGAESPAWPRSATGIWLTSPLTRWPTTSSYRGSF
jgi:hypothetical protein